MGPTASGKTALAVELVQRFPCEIISVDSAMVYRGMDIGTAKPDAETLQRAPHRLIDICDPAEAYSAGRFRLDVLREMDDMISRGKIPLLVGGTMMYFRVLQQGIADLLPSADENIRAQLTERAAREGWAALHAELARVDSVAASKINVNDAQRIQRALEVFMLTGQTISGHQQQNTNPLAGYNVLQLALMPSVRSALHARIAARFQVMLDQGFIEEVAALKARGDLSSELPSIRSVGYRQAWDYLDGVITEVQMRDTAIAATRQLAKRQMTWLRSWPDCLQFDSEASDVLQQVSGAVEKMAG
jgi:tRNA dimethylallyltransferase